MTTTDIAVRGGSDLAIEPTQTFWTEKQVAALRQLGLGGQVNNGDLAVFFHQATRTGLDPFARQIYMIERQGKQTIQTGIDGFRLIARRATDARAGTFGYEDTLWCGGDGKWNDVWLVKEHPRAAKVTVVRDGQRYPAVALWDEYVGTKRGGEITQMWETKGALMLAKCAEALALRKAFPQDLSGLYTSDEMAQADNQTNSLVNSQGPTSGADRMRQALGSKDGQPAAAEAQPETGELITSAQLKKLQTVLRKADITDRDEGLAFYESVVGRPVPSSKELTKAEAAKVIDALEQDDANTVDGEIVHDNAGDEADPDAVWRDILATAGGLEPPMTEDQVKVDVQDTIGVAASAASAGELGHYLSELKSRQGQAA